MINTHYKVFICIKLFIVIIQSRKERGPIDNLSHIQFYLLVEKDA